MLCLVYAASYNIKPIFNSEEFSVFHNRVEQGDFYAEAVESERMVSNYQSPASANFSSTLSFKFAINGKDNEAPSGQDHILTIVPENGRYVTPVIQFGAKDPASFIKSNASSVLPADTEVTIRVDMKKVFREFEEKGFYTNWAGEKLMNPIFMEYISPEVLNLYHGILKI